MKALKTLAVVVVVLVLLSVLGGLIAQSVLAGQMLDPILEKTAADAERHWPAIEDDLKALGAHPFFAAKRTDQDAGAFLNPLSSWRGQGETRGELQTRLEAVAESIESLTTDPLDPGRALDETQIEALRSLDFAWMKALLKYGRWSIFTDSPAGRMDPLLIASMPIPDYIVLQRWVKLRLYRGVVDDDLQAATAESMHLAWLCVSSESLIGAMVGTAMTGIVRQMDPSSSVTEEDGQRMKRLFWASPAFASWAVPPQARVRFRESAKEHLPIAACTGWSEGAMHLMLMPFLESRFDDYYELLKTIQPGDGCHYEMLLRARAQVEKDPLILLDDVDDKDTADNAKMLAKMPIARGIVGIILASIATPDWLRHYSARGNPAETSAP